MNALLISIAVATLGIDVGWQRLPEGGMQYIIQLDPQALAALRAASRSKATFRPARATCDRIGLSWARDLCDAICRRRDRRSPMRQARNRPPRVGPHCWCPRRWSRPGASSRLPGSRRSFEEPEGKRAAGKPQSQPATKPAPQEPAKPWLPLIVTLIGLFGSLAANVYLGWLAVEFRRRCRALMPSAAAP